MTIEQHLGRRKSLCLLLLMLLLFLCTSNDVTFVGHFVVTFDCPQICPRATKHGAVPSRRVLVLLISLLRVEVSRNERTPILSCMRGWMMIWSQFHHYNDDYNINDKYSTIVILNPLSIDISTEGNNRRKENKINKKCSVLTAVTTAQVAGYPITFS